MVSSQTSLWFGFFNSPRCTEESGQKSSEEKINPFPCITKNCVKKKEKKKTRNRIKSFLFKIHQIYEIKKSRKSQDYKKTDERKFFLSNLRVCV